MIESAMLFITDPAKMLFVILSLVAGLISLVLWKYSSKTFLLYAHLIFLLAPLFYFAESINCELGFMESLLGFCTALAVKGVLYVLPFAVVGSFMVGRFVIPFLYARKGKRVSLALFSQVCKKTGIVAQLYVLDNARPVAFAFANKVFVSVGMFELFSQKELEAVLLHELYHIKARSSWTKFSAVFVETFSPVARFFSSSDWKEEQKADAFARKLQGSNKYLSRARKKACSF